MVSQLAKLLPLVALLSALAAHAADRPNIVFAIADDWGRPHASAYGDKGIKTPAFDRLAREGVLFENAYISSPSCTPSRGAIITGQQFWRLGAAGNLMECLALQVCRIPEAAGRGRLFRRQLPQRMGAGSSSL